jgi:hypothetical protein
MTDPTQQQQLNDALRFALSDETRLADQLAEALRRNRMWGEDDRCWCPFDTHGSHEPECEQAQAALAAYEEARNGMV